MKPSTPIIFQSACQLFEAIESVLSEGTHTVAEKLNIASHELMAGFRASYSLLCTRPAVGGIFEMEWTEWAEIDPKYTPPHIAMKELKNLIDCFAIGVSVCIDMYAHKSAEKVMTKAAELSDKALSRADSILHHEILKGADAHKCMHLDALATYFVASILTIIDFACNPNGNSATKVKFNGCTNLCGPIDSVCSDAAEILDGAKPAAPAKSIKRHGNLVTLNELADIWGTSTSDIKSAINKGISALRCSRSDRLISIAEKANINTNIQALPPNSAEFDGVEWYSEKQALKYLGIDTMLEVPAYCRPQKYLNDGVDWYIEADIVNAYREMHGHD